MKPSNNFYSEYTTEIQRKFDIIKSNIITLEEDDELEDFSLNELSLCFYRKDSETQGTKAYFLPDDLTHKNIIVYLLDTEMGYEMTTTIYHEVSHFLCRKYLNIKHRVHCLEFAIFHYGLQAKFSRQYNSFYLKSEDICEDRAWRFLKTNVSEFDDLINALEFKTLRQLANKALFLANEIRKKAVPYDLHDTRKHL